MNRLASLLAILALAACGMQAAARGDGDDPTASDASTTAPDGALAQDAGSPPEGSDAEVDVVPRVDASPGPAPLVARLNVGGGAHVGVAFPGAWAASPVPGGACGPDRYAAGSPVHGTLDGPLFTEEAFGAPLRCAIGASALAKGTYRVKLLFAEIFFGPGCPGGGGAGSRVFDILLEGKEYAKGIDVFVESGGCLASTTSDAGIPIARTYDVAIDDGTLDIELKASSNNAKLSAVEVHGPL